MPIANVASAMTRTDSSTAFFRPHLSPIQPNTTPPSGRMQKAPAKTAKVSASASTGSVSGKKSTEMVSAK